MNFDVIYLMDTVSVAKLSQQEVSSNFVHTYCRVPDEILYELRDSSYYAILDTLRYEVSADVLRAGREFLKSLAVNNLLLDLYNFEGNGDLILIAVALHEAELNSHMLMRTEWKILTDDKGLRAAAEGEGVVVVTTEDFKRLLRENETPLL